MSGAVSAIALAAAWRNHPRAAEKRTYEVAHTNEEWHKLLDREDIPNGPMRTLQELLHDPYLTETGFFHHYEHPTEGAAVTTAIPVNFSQTPANLHRPPPCLGEHTQEVFAEIGLSEADIAKLR